MLVKRGVRRARGHRDIPAAALGVETGGDRDGLDQRRLAAAVLAGEERHVRVERELVQLPDRRDRERVDIEVAHRVPFEDDRAHEWIAPATRQR